MLYLITNRKLVQSNNYLSVIQQAVEGGIECIILREKDLPTEELRPLAIQVRQIVKDVGIKLIINGNLSVAKEVGTDGFHTTFSDFIHNKYDFPGTIGVSVHSIQEAIQAEQRGADYLLASHIFPTKCKEFLPPKGVEFIAELKEKVSIPVIALGGIHEKNIRSVYVAGADGVAVMSYVMAAEQPRKAAKRLKKNI